ncbi:MAG TPA: bifunctional histidinol-phosphatase/imidazoleglycerol-phosphate dehydratase HisB [Steroidobacteraceae bacterium]|nr:bifunctional histidinol-phosphatase/imidazoleglycerol-phosphate dehydratase HisB [Steroidobacteraceae bacterium]
MRAAVPEARPVLFIDRDGTLVEEPADQQVDALEKIRFLPGVFAALGALREAGYRLVMVSNQDGLGTASFPREDFERCQEFILRALASQGILFEAIFTCPHRPADGCDCRKPQTGLLREWQRNQVLDLARSAVIGDRDSDLEFAVRLGVRGLRVRHPAAAGEAWPDAVRELLARRARIERRTRETAIEVSVELDGERAIRVSTGIGFFDHMLEQLARHGGFGLQLNCAGDLRIDEHHTVEDCALALGEALRGALGDKAGIGRYGFLLPMDEAEAQVAIDLSGRAYCDFAGQFGRAQVGALPTELVPHFFRSLSDALGCALHLSVRGENTHHMIEACFKGVGRALRPALCREGRELPTTKGWL